MNAYEEVCGDGVLDIKQCEKAIDNRKRYLNIKIKDEEFMYNDLNIKSLQLLEIRIESLKEANEELEKKNEELEKENEKCWKKIEKLKFKKL